jgi:hypothetical protein
MGDLEQASPNNEIFLSIAKTEKQYWQHNLPLYSQD